MLDTPFNIIKKVLYIQDSEYSYSIDEDGNGVAIIDNQTIRFHQNSYGEIVLESIYIMQNL